MTRSGAGLAVLVALGLALGAAGCGSSGTTGAAAAGTPGAGASARPTDGRAWSQCMRGDGIAMPDLDPRTGRPVDAAAPMPDKHAPGFDPAVQACAALEPAGGSGGDPPLT